jgi:putative ABC transport system permease protein
MTRLIKRFRLTLRAVFRGDRVNEELDEELQYHMECLIDEGVAKGLSQREARYAAVRAMGATGKNKDECRDARRVNFIDDLQRDLRYAARSLRRNPGFAALAVLIMALGLGANTAVFSVVNAVLLRPLAYRDPDRIVILTNPSTASGSRTGIALKNVAIPNFNDWRDQSSSFEAMAYYGSREAPVVAGATAEYARATAVGPGFFRVFAVEPVLGRVFTPEELKPGAGGGVAISYGYWQSHFGRDPKALGQNLRIYGNSRPIVGVLPPGFGYPDKTDLWFPARVSAQDMNSRLAQNWLAAGRLKPGISLQHAQIEMTTIARRLEQQYPLTNKNVTVRLTRLRDEMVGDFRATLFLLLGAVSVVLLIACANTATLLLGKATARTREIAIRAALGAGRRRIVRQLITESLLLAFLAGASGLLLAYGGVKVLVWLPAAALPRFMEVGIDRWVLAFTLGLSVITSLLFGLVPALYASKADLNEALKQAGTRSVTAAGMFRTRGMLVVTEIALAVALVAGAGLLIKSFKALHDVPVGYRPEKVLVMRATVPAPTQAQAASFFKDLLPEIANVPGVVAAGATMAPPGRIESSGGYFIDHLAAQPDWHSAPPAAISVVAPGTFAALGIPLKNGRDFSDSDVAGRPLVVIVNEALVRKSFAGENPIGRTIFCPFDSFEGMTIIGVSGDVRQDGPASEPMPECYITYRQHAFNGNTLSIVVRTAGDPNTLIETLRRMAHATSPDVPMKFTTMDAIVSSDVAAPRFRTVLFGIFAALAVCLAMAGVYGVMAYAVGQRSNEIGLRMALGASAGSVIRLILGQGLVLAAFGLAVGLAIAMAGTRLLTTMLFHVKPNDPTVYVAVVVLLGLVALIAGYVPARRAARIDPLTALRQE